MNKEDVSLLLAAINTEVDFLLMLEKRGLQLGEQLGKLFTVREKLKGLKLEQPADSPVTELRKVD